MEAPARTDATAPAPEDQLAALREEVVQARAAMQRVFNRIYELVTWAFLVALILGLTHADSPWKWVVAVACIPVSITLGWLLAWPAVRRISRQRALALRARVAGLTAEQQAVLLPVERARTFPRTPSLSERLLSDLSLPTELTPAASPTSRGDEPTPAE